MDTILELKNIHKSYGKKEVLKGIDLTVKEGEIISVLGPSGCGKSTLLNIIAGILPLDDGQVIIHNEEVSSTKKMVPIEKRNINMVFQDFALWPHMKAKDNILYGLKVKKQDKKIMDERLHEVESLLHLEGLLEQYPSELSGGQQQRVAIARALITNPTIILLDEPLCNLDIQLRIEMRTEMAQLFKHLKTTVFHVTHDPSEAFAMADRIIVMNHGVIDQIDTPSNCYTKPQTSVVAGLLGAGNFISNAKVIQYENEHAVMNLNGVEVECCCFQEVEKEKEIILQFRPEDCAFSTSKLNGGIPVQVEMSTFEGRQYRVKVKTVTGDSFCLLSDTYLQENEQGYVYINKERLYAYEKTSN